MKNAPKISIVMPAYNAEKKITNAIESVIQQKFKKWELLIVNDGSSDNTLQVCNTYARKDERIKVYSQKNKGPSSARNTALNLINGDLLMFLDADDTLEKHTLSILVSVFEENNNIDLCIFAWNIIRNGKKITHKFSKRELRGNKEDYFRNIAYSSNWDIYSGGYPWNKVWKVKTIFKDGMIKFNEHVVLLEDRLFTLEAIDKINKLKVINHPLYNYVINENSTSHSSNISTILKQNLYCYDALKYEYKYIEKYHNSARDIAQKALLQGQINCLWFVLRNFERKDILNELQIVINDFRETRFKYLNLKLSIKYILIRLKLHNFDLSNK